MDRPRKPYVFVEWLDHQESDNVAPSDLDGLDLHLRQATGWLVLADHDKVMVAQDWNTKNGEWSGVLVLGRPLIVRASRLEVVRSRKGGT